MPASLKASLRSLSLAAVLLAAPQAFAQSEPRAVVEIGAVVQDYTTGSDQSIGELTIPLRASVAVMPGFESLHFELWLVAHRELRTNRRVRRVFDVLNEALSRNDGQAEEGSAHSS